MPRTALSRSAPTPTNGLNAGGTGDAAPASDNVINFADTFPHLPLSMTDRVNNTFDLLVEAFVTQVSIADGYSCGFAAPARHANAALCFLQAIEPTHCP